MKVRKKPIMVEAIQFTRDMILNETYPKYVSLGRLEMSASPYLDKKIVDYRFYIETLEGKMDIKIGDWLITGVKSEHYPCKPDIFEMTYEIIDQ